MTDRSAAQPGQPAASDCVLVIPCYNEAGRLDLAAIRGFLERAESSSVRLLFVDDGSTDRTAETLETLREGAPAVQIARLSPNRGKAEAVRTGLLAALDLGPTWVGFWDADLATPLEAVDDFLEIFRIHPEVEWVIGSRAQLLGRAIRRHATRHYMGRVFATLASLLLGIPVYDTQCGAKLFRASPELRDLLARPFLSRWYFDVELLARFVVGRAARGQRADAAIYEASLRSWTDVPGSRMRPRDLFRAFSDLSRIWWRYRPRRYLASGS